MKKRRNASAVAAEQLSREYPERATLVVQIHHNPHPARGVNYAWVNLPEGYRARCGWSFFACLKR
jgi:hypothetical protein